MDYRGIMFFQQKIGLNVLNPLFYFFLFAALIFNSALAANNKKLKSECSKKMLQLKNCKLKYEKYDFSFWRERFSVSDGVNRQILDWPLKHEKVEWSSVQVEKKADRLFLKLVAWQEPNEKTNIQTQFWHVYEVIGAQVQLKLEKPILKRKVITDEKTKSDKSPRYGLSVVGSDVYWNFENEKGLLK